MDWLWIGVGGFAGANARYWLGRAIVFWLGPAFPYHTLLINVSGSFAVGVLLALITERLIADPVWRLVLVAGFLGGYTTFSSYTFEAVALAEQGRWLPAVGYVLGSNGLGLLACWAGILTSRTLP